MVDTHNWSREKQRARLTTSQAGFRAAEIRGARQINPFGGTTEIRFAIPQDENVDLKLYDLTGRAVAVLVQRSFTAGSHAVRWAGVDDAGRQLASGVYFLRIQAGAFSATQRIVLVR